MEDPKKRHSGEGAESSARKKLKVDVPVSQNTTLQELQDTIDALEADCTKEQLRIQREFDAKKQQHFKARDQLMATLNLWPRAIVNNQAVSDIIQEEDLEILKDHLHIVDLQDHIDDNGTFEIKFEFKPSAAKLFTPTTLVKRLVFNNHGGIDLPQCTVTEAKFADETKNPIALIRKKKEAAVAAEKEGAESDDGSSDSDIEVNSIFEWFSTKGDEVWPGFADYFRSIIYQNPVEPALGPDVSEMEDTSDDDDEDDE
eukprot:Gregarina_sp_Pseudo_9__2266@NODE_2599_length_941_cov_123_696231_g2383_i0_p1_GENE_NODE_2599_length_941_cov_123_696231_g2383_i0NODE_2599_length_941_cov_123_696231_g2383_i0_p1_ORF_typecomplete_len257_score87_30NAP/PF00956_18/4_8e15_NODE_2599_length_941_cov_123_696231_g2383_i080850